MRRAAKLFAGKLPPERRTHALFLPSVKRGRFPEPTRTAGVLHQKPEFSNAQWPEGSEMRILQGRPPMAHTLTTEPLS